MNRPAGAFTYDRAVRLPDGRDGWFHAEWDPATLRGSYAITVGHPPAVAVFRSNRLEADGLSEAEFMALCRRWLS